MNDVPPGACDCHVHVILDQAEFPFAPERVYTCPQASVAALQAHLARLGLARVVIVQPSVYGTDNRATLAGIAAIGLERARGVAVVDPLAAEAELDALHSGGVRGIRLNLEQTGGFDAEGRLQAALSLAARRGWHVQAYTRLAVIEALAPVLAEAKVPVVIDHFGGAVGALGVAQPGFATLLGLVRAEKCYVKISGAYRSSLLAPDYADMAPFAQALIAANPERVLWGSDWPHPDPLGSPVFTDIAPNHDIDDAAVFAALWRWAPDAALRQRILVDNPARLYGFGGNQ
jgi:predicted TIM-barrel fold metal-dependent hydrolase